MMNEITNYMFRLSVERGGETVLNTVIAAGGDDVQKAKRTVQKLLNDFTPGGGKPARAPVVPDLAGTAAQEREGRETAEELPSPEPAPEPLQERRDGQGGVRGTVQLLCGGCGSTIGTFLKNRQAEFRCKCGDSIDLTRPLARFEYTCPYCEAKIWGLTNMEKPDITIKCRCGSPVDLQWVPKIREYRN